MIPVAQLVMITSGQIGDFTVKDPESRADPGKSGAHDD
jgi:hypothetical protein